MSRLLTITQPFPANLMVGFYAIADESQPTRTDLDNELEGSSIIRLICNNRLTAAQTHVGTPVTILYAFSTAPVGPP